MRNLTRTLAAVLMALAFSVQSSFAETILTEANLASGKTATASSTEGGRSAGDAIDGQATATPWGPNYNAEGEEKDRSWWKLNLGSAQAFTTIRIYYNNQAPKKAKIEISNNDTEWTEVAQVGSDYNNAADDHTYIYKVGHCKAQYIRISCIEGGTYGMGFNEFEVYNHNYYLKAISVSPATVNKYITSNITITGTDNEGDAYYEFTPTGTTDGTVINATNASLGQYSIVFNTTIIGENETITATDKNDNTKTATTTIGVQAPVISSLVDFNEYAKKDFVSAGDLIQMVVNDQFGGQYPLEGLTLSANTTAQPTADGNTIAYTVPAVENGGTITLSVSNGPKTLTRNLYVLGNNLPAPRIPTDVYKPVITVSDNDDSHIHFTYGTDGTAEDKTAYTPNGLYVKRIIQDKSIVVGRHNTEIFPISNAQGQINWNPYTDYAAKLKADIFSAHAGNQARFKIEGGPTTTPVTLNEGWNTIEWDCSDFNNNITAIRIESKRADNTYPDVLITNLYFTQKDLATSKFTVTSVTAGDQTYTENTDHSAISGIHGYLKEIINARLEAAGNGKTYMDVTDITIEGTLDTRDLRTLREMGGVKFNITTNSKGFTAEQMAAHPYYFENDEHINNYRGHYGDYGGESTHGNLHKLDLSNTAFTVVSMNESKAMSGLTDEAWDALSDAEKIAINNKDNIMITMPYETANGDWDFVDRGNTGSLHNINQFAFLGCVNLEEVTLPNVPNLTIGMHAFENCENLQKVHNMDKVRWFADFCFNQNKSLVGGNSAHVSDGSKLEFSANLANIGYVAFQGCENLKLYSRHLPDNITSIGDMAFASCKGFDSYIVYPNNPSLDIAHMATGVFLNCSNLQQVYIPSTTVTFGYMEFQGCSKLTDVNFYNAGAPAWTTDAVADEKPSAINETAYSANLVNVIANAFADCVALKDENFKRLYNTKLIGSTAFAGCKLMTDDSFNTLIKHFCDGNDQNNKNAGGGKVLSNEPSLCDYTVPYRAFHGCDNLTTVDFRECENTVVRIDTEAFSNCDKITTVVLPVALTSMGDIVFANCTALQKVTVQNSVAPTMDHETLTYEVTVKNEQGQDVKETRQANIFLNTPSEKVEIIFPEELKTANDASGYKTYRANAHFMEAMKRTLNENAATYDVTPQYGADVTLIRTFKASQWNTLVLPFGLQNNNSRTNHTANVLSAALNNGTIAAYRGVSNDQTFVFMTYKNTDAIKAFMPVITYTTTEKVNPVFEDVDVNFDDAGEKIAAANMNVIAYSGNKGDAIPASQDNLDAQYTGDNALANTGFQFTGAFKTVYSERGLTAASINGGTADINNGDYIIQSNAFYEVQNADTKAYRVKAFRGWFKKQGANNAKFATMSIQAVDGMSNITDEIVQIDTETGEQIKPENIYSLNGTLVRSNATTTDGLPKGIYIKGGKKIVVR